MPRASGCCARSSIFLGRTKAPTEDEQAEIYTAIAKTLAPGQPLVIRTLDVGGDKPLPYLPMAPEENPFLGERGIRVGLNWPMCCAPRSGRSSGRSTPERRST